MIISEVIHSEITKRLRAETSVIFGEQDAYIESMHVITIALPVGHYAPHVQLRIVINEYSANVRLTLESTNTMGVGYVISEVTVPFADPNCIDKVVNIICGEIIQNDFIVEYDGANLIDALDQYFKEKKETWRL